MGEQRPLYQEDDWVKMSLAIPFQYKPGTHFVYNNVGPYLGRHSCTETFRMRSGLLSYTKAFLNILEIKRPTWEIGSSLETDFGAGGLFLTHF